MTTTLLQPLMQRVGKELGAAIMRLQDAEVEHTLHMVGGVRVLDCPGCLRIKAHYHQPDPACIDCQYLGWVPKFGLRGSKWPVTGHGNY